MDLNSDYYSVFDGDGNKYADCGWEKDAQKICELHEGEGFTYRHSKMAFDPETVNVNAETLEPDKQLKGQHVLPKSELEPFIT
tara:strand:+ start:230 stop:478 length:249 start_codon:yes stop_codon:yes gene_type:complete